MQTPFLPIEIIKKNPKSSITLPNHEEFGKHKIEK
jgi:hypothetical protein